MANTTNTTSYLDPPSLIGRLNNDGTISLTPLELKRLNDFNYAVSKMIQGGLNLANLNADTNQVFTDIEGNVTTLQTTAEGLQSSVASADGKATTAQQTADGLTTRVSSAEGDISSLEQTASGLSVRVSDVESRNTVTINANGMYVTDQNGNTTALTGDHIKSGTLEGVTLLSINSNNSMVKIYNGGIDLGEAPYYNMGSLYYDMNIGKVYLYSVPGRPMKIESGSNLSIDASNTIYIGASSGYSGIVNIGRSGGTINLNGTVMVNGVPYAPAGGGK